VTSNQPGYSQAFVNQHEAAAEAQRQADAAENERLRNNYLAGLAAKQAAAQAEQDARLEAALAPERDRLEREWLANHPDHSPEDFRRRAWPQLRQNLGDERAAQHLEAQKEALRATGKYGF